MPRFVGNPLDDPLAAKVEGLRLDVEKLTRARVAGRTGPLAPVGSWVNYGGAFAPASATLTGAGEVSLSGLVRGGPAGQPILVLPEGMRPAYQAVFAVACSPGSGDSSGRVDVMPTGAVLLISPFTSAAGYVSLDGIRFRAG